MESAEAVSDMSQVERTRRGGVLYVPIVMARTPMRTHPLIPNRLGELEMIRVIPANAPRAMVVLQADSVASSNNELR